MAEAIDAIVTQQPASKTYRVMTAVAYYAGLRPSEVVMLRVRSAELPDQGWGRLDVTEADISFDEPGEPKTGPLMASGARIGRPATNAHLRLPPRRSHHMAPRRHAAGRNRTQTDTASKPSSPPTSAPSTTQNTSPTNESTPTSNQTRRATGHRARDDGQV